MQFLLLLVSTPTVLAADAGTWHHAGAAGEDKELPFDAIVAAILADPDGRHLVWAPGWPAWKSWDEVPELVAAVEAAKRPPAPAPPPLATETWSYSSGGEPVQLSAAEVAERVKADPDGRHLVWQTGWPEWKDVHDVEAIEKLLKAPPPPPVKPPPPPPVAEKTPGFLPPGRMGFHVDVGGEVRAGIGVVALGVADVGPAGGLDVTRARLRVEGELGDHARAHVALDPAEASMVPEAWAQVGFSSGRADHHLRVGAQQSVFGSRDWFDRYDAYYLGGVRQGALLGAFATLGEESASTVESLRGYLARPASDSLAQRFEVIDGDPIALTWHSGMDETFSLDAQAARGALTETGTAERVDLTGRVGGRFVPAFGFWVTGHYGSSFVEDRAAKLSLVDAVAEVRAGPARVLAEVLYGAQAGDGFSLPTLGLQVAAAGDLDMKAEAIDHLTVVGRLALYDPIVGDEYDQLTSAAAAANLYWDAGEESDVLTGLAWELVYPQNGLVPIFHQVTLQVAADF